MKKTIGLLALIFLLLSCSDDTTRPTESAEFLGKWGLSEILMDPGDGSGTFRPVDTFSSIEFLPNGKITSNYSLCPSYTGSETYFATTYNAGDNTISLKDCDMENYTISYSISEGNLILSYPCIEACEYKFERLAD